MKEITKQYLWIVILKINIHKIYFLFMKFLYSMVFISLVSISHAQYGINIAYNLNDHEELNKIVFPTSDNQVFSNSLEIGIDYWARLKNYRVEFYPEISMATSKSNISRFDINLLQKTALKLKANTRFYPLDFAGDCDCPTFSKQGNWFTKGFFLYISPGLNWEKYKGNTSSIDMTKFIWSIAGGIGLDIGVNDLITLSPNVGYRYNSNLNWPELARVVGITELNFNYTQIQMGLRLGIRFDYANKRGY